MLLIAGGGGRKDGWMDGRKEKRPIRPGIKSKENNSEKIFTIHMTKAHFSYCTKSS